ncbi:uncharacterized protein LOC106076876 [Biomphalaria glabrata]|uniref:Uncharacterized protein LOC106076876 n=1 Tax=Biomphalaria glabrata TaxID=6526 RepID=A0A9W2YX54_BIOGL|nr:uncharacterized protein LOC106076876 [Biomphalaria glabrata]XP_055867318.1 uncharacterized protein LOC106076876 [Biomphalaria glabrata]
MAYFKVTSSVYISITVFTIHFIVVATDKATLRCRPAEEGKPYNLSASYFPKGHDQKYIFWEKDHSVFSECDVGNCLDSNARLTRTTLNITSTGVYESTLHLYNVHRDFSGEWKLKYIELDIANCKLGVFAKPKLLDCNSTIFLDGVTVDCRAYGVFPKIKCAFNVKINKISKDFTNFTTTRNEKIEGEIEFYDSFCILTIPVSSVEIGRLEIEPELQLEVANEIVHLDLNYSLDLIIDKPKITLYSCQTGAERVTCSCIVQESNLEYTLAWYSGSGEVIQNGSELSYSHNSHDEDYFCIATNVLGMKSEPVFLRKSVDSSVGLSISSSNPKSPIELVQVVAAVLGSVIGGMLLIAIVIYIMAKRSRKKRINYKQQQYSIEKISDLPSAYNPLYNQMIVNQTLPYLAEHKLIYLGADEEEAKIYSSIDN